MRLPILFFLLVAVTLCSEELNVSSNELHSNDHLSGTRPETIAKEHIKMFLTAIKDSNVELLFKLVAIDETDKKNAAELIKAHKNVMMTVQSAKEMNSDQIDVQILFVMNNKKFIGTVVLSKNEESPTGWKIYKFPNKLVPAKRRRMLPENKMINN